MRRGFKRRISVVSNQIHYVNVFEHAQIWSRQRERRNLAFLGLDYEKSLFRLVRRAWRAWRERKQRQKIPSEILGARREGKEGPTSKLKSLKNNSVNLIDWAWPFCPSFKRLNRTQSLETFRCFRQTHHCSWMIPDDLPRQIHNVNSRLNSYFAATFKFKLTDTARKKSLQDSSFAVFFSKLL